MNGSAKFADVQSEIADPYPTITEVSIDRPRYIRNDLGKSYVDNVIAYITRDGRKKCFGIASNAGRIFNPKVVWWRQSGNDLNVLLRRGEYSHSMYYLATIDLTVEGGCPTLNKISQLREKQPTDEIVANDGRYVIYAASTKLRERKDLRDGYLGHLSGDVLSFIDAMASCSLRASDFTIATAEFTRSNVFIAQRPYDGRYKSRTDCLVIHGEDVKRFEPGAGIVFLSGGRVIVYGPYCYYGSRGTALYEYTHAHGLRLLENADLREFCTPTKERPDCPLKCLLEPADTAGWTAVYANSTDNWLCQEIDVSDVAMENYGVLSVDGDNYRVSLKPKDDGRTVMCVINRSGELIHK